MIRESETEEGQMRIENLKEGDFTRSGEKDRCKLGIG